MQYQSESQQGILHRQSDSKIKWKFKGMRIAKTILKMNKVGESTLSNFKIYYKATVVMTARHWQRERCLSQRNKLENPKIK